jgi:hypothetical protein
MARIDVSWTSVGGLLQLYKYEPFSNTFTATVPGDTLTYATSSTELLAYLTGTGTTSASFRSPGGATVAYSNQLTLAVRASNAGSQVAEVTTKVQISPARLIVTPCNTSLTFYRNEPISPVTVSIACNPASTIYAATTLPVGLSLTTRSASNAFDLVGTPTIQTVGSNYTLLGQDTAGRIYSLSNVSIVVNPERFLFDAIGTLTQSNLLPTAAIDPIAFTSRFPPYPAAGSMRYSWSAPPPAGIQFRGADGVAISGTSFTIGPAVDPSYSLTLSGTITEAQLQSFALTNTNSYSLTVSAVRTVPLPALSPASSKTITFRFGETLLMSSNVPPLVLVGVPVSAWTYSAKTYFRDLSIASIGITEGFLPDGLDGSFTPLSQTYAIAGTPTYPGPYSFTLTATNGSTSVSLPVATTVATDSVTITSLSDACFNFIQNRALSRAKPGFYPEAIRYSATASSKSPVTMTGTNLPAGVTIDPSNGVFLLSGRPTTPAGASVATLTARVPASGAVATTTFAYSVSADLFTFQELPTIVAQQNVAITPVQIDVSTFSEEPILRYSAGTLPESLLLTNTGRIFGTMTADTGGSFPVTAFTAYGAGSKSYSYSVERDQVLLVPSVQTIQTAPGSAVSLPIAGYSLSTVSPSNYRFADPFPYGLSLNPTTGLLSGVLSPSLPATTSFTILGSVGTLTGTLQATMTTTNLPVNRAHVIEIRSDSTLRISASDDNARSWSLLYAQSNEVAGRIGDNRRGIYLVPTSSGTVLRRLPTTSGFAAVTITPPSGWSGGIYTGVANKPGTSTWWVGGTLSNAGTRRVYVFKTDNDGLTWDAGTAVTTNGFTDRGSNSVPYPSSYDAYLNGGVELAYSDGVLLLGGNQLLRSTTDGATWSAVPTALSREIAMVATGQGTVWVLAGSDTYSSLSNNTYTTAATTLQYSVDNGESWTAASGGFTMNAYQVVYGTGAWIATGLDRVGSDFVERVRVSFDGVNWSVLTAIPFFMHASTLAVKPLGVLAPIGFDDTDWELLRVLNDGTVMLYTHPYDTPLDSGWSTRTPTGSLSGATATSRFTSYVTQDVDPGDDVTTITFAAPASGPTFLSPTQTTYVVPQYMPIPPIVVRATTLFDTVAYLIASVPVGLTWTPSTRTITGACMRTGDQTFTIFAVDSIGQATSLTLTFLVEIPRIINQQSGAGAYTSLVRQYTNVNGAQLTRGTQAFPSQGYSLGEFAWSDPSDRVPRTLPFTFADQARGIRSPLQGWVAYYQRSGTIYVGLSRDGIAWTWTTPFAFSGTAPDVTWSKQWLGVNTSGDRLLLAGGFNGSIQSTSDFVTWTRDTTNAYSAGGICFAVNGKYGNKTWFANGTGARLLCSTDDGRTFSNLGISGMSGNGFAIEYNSQTGTMCACGGQGGGGYIVRSTTPTVSGSWSRVLLASAVDYVRSLACGVNGLWLCGTWNGIYSSINDGATWTGPTNTPHRVNYILYSPSNDTFYVVTQSGGFFSTQNGITLTTLAYTSPVTGSTAASTCATDGRIFIIQGLANDTLSYTSFPPTASSVWTNISGPARSSGWQCGVIYTP